MRLTVVGCSGSYPGPASPASCYLVSAEDGERTWRIVLDLGSGSLGALQRHTDLEALDALLVTHLHPDHCMDVTGLYVTRKYCPGGGVAGRLPVYAPAGAADRFAAAYEGIGPEGMSRELDVRRLSDGVPIHIGPFVVTPYRVNHPVEAYGFRVAHDGRVLAYTGDTDTCEALTPLMRDADLVLTDSAFVDGRDTSTGIHLSGSRAARAAVDAGGVGRLVLTHIPAWNDPEVCRAQASAVWSGDGRAVELAEPDATYEV